MKILTLKPASAQFFAARSLVMSGAPPIMKLAQMESLGDSLSGATWPGCLYRIEGSTEFPPAPSGPTLPPAELYRSALTGTTVSMSTPMPSAVVASERPAGAFHHGRTPPIRSIHCDPRTASSAPSPPSSQIVAICPLAESRLIFQAGRLRPAGISVSSQAGCAKSSIGRSGIAPAVLLSRWSNSIMYPCVPFSEKSPAVRRSDIDTIGLASLGRTHCRPAKQQQQPAIPITPVITVLWLTITHSICGV